MELEKFKLKELLKITRNNKLQDEAKLYMGLKDLKYAKRKGLLEFLKTKEDLININEVDEDENIPDDICESDYEEEYATGHYGMVIKKEPKEEEQPKQEQPKQEQPKQEQPKQEQPDKREIDFIQLDLSDLQNKKKVRRQQQPTQPPPKVETNEERKEREQAIMLLNNYYNRFQWLHNEIIEVPNDDPLLKLKVVKAKLSSRNMSNLFAEHFFSVCYGAEYAITTAPYISDYVKLNGFTNNLRAYESTRDLLDELLIEYAPMIGENQQISVEARLGMVMLAVGVQTHINNTQQPTTQPIQIQQQQPVQKIDINKTVDDNKFNVDI
jgi:hypothetical protein